MQAEWRKKRGVTLRDLRAATTIALKTLHDYETTGAQPKWPHAWVIIAALKIPLNCVIPSLPPTLDSMCGKLVQDGEPLAVNGEKHPGKEKEKEACEDDGPPKKSKKSSGSTGKKGSRTGKSA